VDVLSSLQSLLASLDPRLLAHVLQIFRLVVWLVVLAAIFTPLERLFGLHPKKIFRPAILTDLFYYFLSSLLPSLILSVPLALVASAVHHVIPHDYTAAIAAWPLWLRVGASLFVGEIGFYWGHRWSHEIPFLWRFHAIHHSPEHLDYLVNTRAHPVDMVFTRLCGLVPLYILGLASPARGSGSLIPVLIILAGTLLGFFIHSNVRWRFGPLERLIATPAFHHWHHTNDSPTLLNQNYSPMLPWVDQLFGTLYLPADRQPLRYGIGEPIDPSLAAQLIDPFLPRRKSKPRPAASTVATSNQGPH